MESITNVIKNAYNNSPANDAQGNPEKTYVVDYVLDKLEVDPIPIFSPEAMDIYPHKNELAEVLSDISPDIMCSEFGKDTLIWICSNLMFESKRKEYHKKISRYTNTDFNTLEKALLFSEHELDESDIGAVISTHKLIEYVNENAKHLDLRELTRKYQNNKRIEKDKNGVPREITIKINPERLDQFSLSPMNTSGKNIADYDEFWAGYPDQQKKLEYNVFLDSPIGIGLMYENRPCAVFSFYASDAKTLKIVQIQGVKPKDLSDKNLRKVPSRGLDFLIWDKMLLEITENIAIDMGFEQIAIKSGLKHEFYGIVQETMHMDYQTAMKRYDLFAESMEFEQKEDMDWYRRIEL